MRPCGRDPPRKGSANSCFPRAVDLDRAIGALEAVRDVARKKGILRSMSGIDVGRSQSTLAGSLIVTAQPIAFRATLNEEGLATFLQAVDLAGALTIDDLLEPSVREALFLQTETENPVAILSLEQFLSTDLLSFAKDPKPHEERLKKAFSSDGLSQYEHLLHATRLRSSLPLLRGDLGATLEARGLWPLPRSSRPLRWRCGKRVTAGWRYNSRSWLTPAEEASSAPCIEANEFAFSRTEAAPRMRRALTIPLIPSSNKKDTNTENQKLPPLVPRSVSSSQ